MGPYEGPWIAVEWWWVIPVVMIALCFFMMFLMRKRMPDRMVCMMRPPFLETRSDSPFTGPTDSAKEILDKRYARGEINREEYQEKKADLPG